MGPGHHALQHIGGVVHPAADGDVGFDLVVENGGPVKPEAQLVRAAEYQVRRNLQLLQVEVGLIKTIEDDHAVGAGFGEPLGEVGAGGEVRSQFDGDGNSYTFADGAHQVAVARLQGFGGERRVGGNV